MKAIPGIDREMEARVHDLGFELVDLRWGGSSRRPVLRVRIDRPDSTPGEGVTVHDCESEALPERYVLEVSSPGVDRPLVRRSDFQRFRGQRVAVKGRDVLAGRARRLEGELLGLEDGDGADVVRIRLPDGDEVSIPRDDIAGANLVFTWK